MSDIFISYAHEDCDTAERLAHALEAEGWSVWWDPRLRTGIEYRPAIDGELKRTRCVIVLWSAHSVASTFVCDEAQVGQRRGVLVPVSIEAGVEGALGFRSLHTAELVNWEGSTTSADFRRLADDIGQLLNPPKPLRKPRRASARPTAPVVEAAAPVPAAPAGGARWGLALLGVGALAGAALIWGGSGEAEPAKPAPAVTMVAAPRAATLGTAVPAQRQATPPPALTGLLQFDTSTLDFGPVAVRRDISARPLPLTLRNLGSAAHAVSLVGSGPDLAAFTLDFTLCPLDGAGRRITKECQLSARFTPQREGRHSARYTLLSDGAETAVVVQLSGQGAAPQSVGLAGLGTTVTLDEARCAGGRLALGGAARGLPGDYLVFDPPGIGAQGTCGAWTGTLTNPAPASACVRRPADPEGSAWTYTSRPFLPSDGRLTAKVALRRDVPGQQAVQTLATAERLLSCSR